MCTTIPNSIYLTTANSCDDNQPTWWNLAEGLIKRERKKNAAILGWRFKWLTVFIFIFFFALYCASYKHLTFYGVFALYIVAYNSLMTIHIADERKEYWLTNSKTEHDGLFLRTMMIANFMLVVNFVLVQTARELVPGFWSQGPQGPHPLFHLWTIFRGFTANIATMVNALTGCVLN